MEEAKKKNNKVIINKKGERILKDFIRKNPQVETFIKKFDLVIK